MSITSTDIYEDGYNAGYDDGVDDERDHIINILFGIDKQIAEMVKEVLNNEKGQK